MKCSKRHLLSGPEKHVVANEGAKGGDGMSVLYNRQLFVDGVNAQRKSTDRAHVGLKGKQVSPWHDIPLRAEGGLLNAIIEIPKESCPKLEVATVCFCTAVGFVLVSRMASRLAPEERTINWPRLPFLALWSYSTQPDGLAHHEICAQFVKTCKALICCCA